MIDLGPPDTIFDPRQQLNTHGRMGSWVALSHCWGDSPHRLLVTSANVEQLSRGISMSYMPGTIRDTILMTRKLRIRYLWVDTLCILQDDILDWNMESAKTSTYYKEAHVTLVARDAVADCQSFLADRDSFPDPPL